MDDFNKVIQNLKDYYVLKQELGADFKVLVSFVPSKQTENELEVLQSVDVMKSMMEKTI